MSLSKITYDQKNWCLNVLNHLLNWKITVFFRRPLDTRVDDVPGYYKKIKHPMDLGTLRKNFISGAYNSIEDFVSDLKIIFTNTKTYFGEDTVMSIVADEVLSYISRMEKYLYMSGEQLWFMQLKEIREKINNHLVQLPDNILSSKEMTDS